MALTYVYFHVYTPMFTPPHVRNIANLNMDATLKQCLACLLADKYSIFLARRLSLNISVYDVHSSGYCGAKIEILEQCQVTLLLVDRGSPATFSVLRHLTRRGRE